MESGLIKRLLRKLWSTERAPAAPTQPATGPKGDIPPERKFVVRAPRVPITSLHRIAFEQPIGFELRVHELFNISISGVGLMAAAFPAPPSPGDLLTGTLSLVGDEFQVTLKVARVTPTLVGASFVDRPSGLRDALETYFELEMAAIAMMKVNPEYHKSEPDGSAHWYHGDLCDLYYVTLSDQVLRFRLTFLGNHLERERGGPLITGQIDDAESIGPIKRSERVHEHSQPPKELIETAAKFLKYVADVPRAHLIEILSMIGASHRV